MALVNAPHAYIVAHDALEAGFRLDINCLGFHFIELSNFDGVNQVPAPRRDRQHQNIWRSESDTLNPEI
jgi:hypothetical protein